jgi:hypothetical protein
MRLAMRALVLVFLGLFIFYLFLPTPDFPEPPSGFKQSFEPADVETPLRRGYYTDITREEVMDYYQSQFWGYRLNYPPEEAQTIIRDQTKSTFLEEIVHPFRESLFINGFEPSEPQYKAVIEGREWRQKIIIRYVPSSLWARLVVAAGVVLWIFLLLL